MHWGYCRVSTEEQLQGQSIDSQFRRLVETGIPEDQVLIEIGSATKGRTPELQRLFRLGREGKVKSILAIRQDRFQRNRKTAAQMWELIDQHNVAFRFLDQPDIDPADPTSVLQAQILGAFAQFETEQLSQRVRNGIEQNRRMKKHHGRPPAGYIAIDGHLRPDPETWDIYRQVIQTYLATGSSTAARKLRFELTGKPWAPSAFARWILSPNLRGYVVHGANTDNPQFHHGQHESMLSPAEWDQVQAVRAANRCNTGAFRLQTAPTIASGLFRCQCCGNKMPFKSESTRKRAVYQCRIARGGGCEQGHRNWISLENAAGEIRRAIRIAAQQLAEQITPTDVPESQYLLDLRIDKQVEIEKIAKLTGSRRERAERNLAEINADIAAEEAQLKLDAPQRQAMVRQEFLKLSDAAELEQMNDDDLRSMALRYGLQMHVDSKVVVAVEWTRLGPLFPQLPGFMAMGDLSALDAPATSVRVVELPMPKA